MVVKPSHFILMIVLMPVIWAMRAAVVCARWWYTLRPRKFDWLAHQDLLTLVRGMIGTTAMSIQWSYSTNRTSDLYFALGQDGKFTKAAEDAICARYEPSFVPRSLYLQQLYEQIAAAPEKFVGPYWHIGLDENGQLGIQVDATIDNSDPSYRKRAKFVIMDFGRRAAQAKR